MTEITLFAKVTYPTIRWSEGATILVGPNCAPSTTHPVFSSTRTTPKTTTYFTLPIITITLRRFEHKFFHISDWILF